LQYFYRFLRTKDDGSYLSELKNPIRFYIEEDCKINRDFTANSPIVKMKRLGKEAQVTFGMTDISDVIYAYDFFGQTDRLLARISLDYLIHEFGVSLNVDEQMNTGFSKYLLGKYLGKRIVIPDSKMAGNRKVVILLICMLKIFTIFHLLNFHHYLLVFKTNKALCC